MTTPNISTLLYSSRKEADDLVIQRLLSSVNDQGVPRFLYLSPTRRKNREIEHRLQSIRQTWKAYFLTPKGLAGLILKNRVGRLQPATEDLKLLLATRILETGANSGAFNMLTSFKKPIPQGLAGRLVHAVDKILSNKTGTQGQEFLIQEQLIDDINLFMAEFDSALKEMERFNPSSIANMAAKALENREKIFSSTIDLIIIDGFAEPQPDECRLLEALVMAAPEAETIITAPLELALSLMEHGWEDLPRQFKIYRYLRPFLDYVGVDLSRVHGHKSQAKEQKPYGKEITISGYPDRVAEVKGIARQIKSIFFERKKEGIKPEDFHVAAPSLEPYYRLFMEIFPQYGVPFSITRGVPLSSIPVVGLLQTLLQAIIYRDYRSVFDFFSSSLVTTPLPNGDDSFKQFLNRNSIDPQSTQERSSRTQGPPMEPNGLDPSFIDRFCRSYAVKGGLDYSRDWLRPFSEVIDLMEEQAKQMGSTWFEEKAGNFRKQSLKQLWFLEVEFKEMDKCLNAATMSDLGEQLRSLVSRYQISANLFKSLGTIDSNLYMAREIVFEKNIKGFNRALDLTDELATDFELVGSGKADLEAFNNSFIRCLSNEMIQEAGELAGVSVSQMLEIRNIAGKFLFLAGLTSDSFPISGSNNFIFSNAPGSQELDQTLDLSHYLLDQAMENSESLNISYPRSDADSALEPSVLVEDLLASDQCTAPSESEVSDHAFSRHESLENAARVLRDEANFSWEAFRFALEKYPLSGNQNMRIFQQDIRRRLMALIHKKFPDESEYFEGMIEDEKILQIIRQRFEDPGFHYSTSMLNSYLDCPFSFFLEQVLGLTPVIELPEEIEGRDIGVITHEILKEFYDSVSSGPLKKVTPESRIDVLRLMGTIATRCFQNMPFFENDSINAWSARQRILRGLIFQDTPKVEIQKIEQGIDIHPLKRGLLRVIIDHETRLNAPLIPVQTEYAFGYPGTPSFHITAKENRIIKIKGKIDRIDHYVPKDGPKALWIYDYKTGAPPTLTSVDELQDLQLPLYMLAVLHEYNEFKPDSAAGCFLHLTPRKEDIRQAVIYTPDSPGALFQGLKKKSLLFGPKEQEATVTQVVYIDSQIRAGKFPQRYDKKSCERCGYSGACYRDN